jgi:hypothetical protein
VNDASHTTPFAQQARRFRERLDLILNPFALLREPLPAGGTPDERASLYLGALRTLGFNVTLKEPLPAVADTLHSLNADSRPTLAQELCQALVPMALRALADGGQDHAQPVLFTAPLLESGAIEVVHVGEPMAKVLGAWMKYSDIPAGHPLRAVLAEKDAWLVEERRARFVWLGDCRPTLQAGGSESGAPAPWLPVSLVAAWTTAKERERLHVISERERLERNRREQQEAARRFDPLARAYETEQEVERLRARVAELEAAQQRKPAPVGANGGITTP